VTGGLGGIYLAICTSFPASYRRALQDAGLELIHSECLSGTQLSFALSVRHLFRLGETRPWWFEPARVVLDSLVGRALLAPVLFRGRTV